MKDLFSMEGKVAVVTGGAGYLGSAIVEGLLEFGATVVVAEIADKKPEDIVPGENCNGKSLDKLFVLKCDVSSTDSVRSMFAKAAELCGKIDVLINCAVFWSGGVGALPSVDKMTDEEFAVGLDGVLISTFRSTREAIPYLEKTGGAIVNFSSMYGVVSPDPRIYGDSGQNNPVNYGAGKAGILQFTRYCAAHLAPRNIRVNCITPGPFPAPEKLPPEDFMRNLREKTMLGRVGTPRDLVGAVLLLASGASGFMTGSNITVDGGWTAW